MGAGALPFYGSCPHLEVRAASNPAIIKYFADFIGCRTLTTTVGILALTLRNIRSNGSKRGLMHYLFRRQLLQCGFRKQLYSRSGLQWRSIWDVWTVHC